MENFAHLHVHTEYSLLDGSSKISEIVKQAKKLGMKSLAITDHGAMYGVVDFYKECVEQGIHPVIGCEVYVADKSRFQKDGPGGRGILSSGAPCGKSDWLRESDQNGF